MKNLITLSCLVLSLTLCTGAHAAKVYTWTDSKGVTHYGERPPKDVKATLIHARTGHSEPTPETEQPKPSTNNTPSGTQMLTQDPERCAQATRNLEALKSYNRIKVKDDKGELRVLSEDEKAERIADMQRIVDESC